MWTPRRYTLIAGLAFAVMLTAVPAGATPIISIVIDDTLPNNRIALTWSGMVFGNVTGGADCTQVTGGSGSANCSESDPITFEGDMVITHPGLRFGVNIWEDVVGGLLSDTLRLDPTTIVDAALNIRHIRVVFQSDVEGGPALAPLVVQSGGACCDEVVDWLETNGPLVVVDDRNRDASITINSEAEVPEPTSLLLLGSGLVAGSRHWYKRQRRAL